MNITLCARFYVSAIACLISLSALAGTPVATTTPPIEGFVGEQFCFDADFTNSDPGEAGFSPYYRIELVPGLTLASAEFVGASQTINNEGVFVAPDNELTDSLTGETVSGTTDNTLYTVAYPIGSVTAGSPPLTMELCVDVDVAAVEDVLIPDAINLTPAFRLGNSATGANGPQTGGISDFDFTPRVITYSLTDMTAEGERPPGPAWTFPIEACADIAADRNVAPIDFAGISPISLPANVQFVGPINFTGTGTGCSAVTTPADLTLAPGGQIDLDCTSGDGTPGESQDICATFDVYITDTLDPMSCATDGAINTAKHVAVQKSTSGAVAPGGVRNYTLNFQVSEFVPGISRLIATDTLPDGVTFNDDAVANLGGGPVSLTGALRTITNNSPGTGQTTVTFEITDALGTLPNTATVSVTYTATIDQTFDATGGPVLARDTLNNSVTTTYDVDGAGNATNCTDASSASFTIEDVAISKTLISPPGGVVQPGDPVTFRLSMEIPSGDTNDIVFDDFFPLPVFDATAINTSTDLGGANTDIDRGPNDSLGLTPVSITTAAADNSVRIEWPNVTTTSAQTLEVDITVTVNDEPFADNLVLSNLFQGTTNNTPTDNATALETTSLTVRSPSLSLDKSVSGSATGYVVGDTVSYTITATNDSTAEAYEVIITDNQPTGLVGCALDSVAGGSGAGGDSPFDGDGYLFTTFDGPDTAALDGGASVSVTVSCTVATDVSPDQDITNTASTSWTAQPGATRFTPIEATETITTEEQPRPAKEVVATSESATPETTPRPIAIGEVARFRLSVEFAEGSQTGVELIDLVPAGFQFLDDGSATIAFVSSAGGAITATGFDQTDCVSGTLEITGAAAAVTPTCELPAFGTTFNSGTNVTLALGDVSNTETDADAEFIVIEVNLVNVGGQTNGDTGNNRFRISSNQVFRTSINNVLQFVEPELEVVKQATPTMLDAGDTVTYTITIEHTGDSLADAFDIAFSDTLDGTTLDNFMFIGGPSAPAGETCTAAGASVDSSDPFGAGITISFDALPQGEVCEIQYSARAQSTVVPGTQIQNTASVDYDSLVGTGDPGNATGSPQGTQGTFNADDTASVDVDSTINTKTIDSTSFTHTSEAGDGLTGGTPRILSVGETVRYRLQVTLPEGSAPDFIVTDLMPDGLQYQTGSARIALVAEGAGITPTPGITCTNAGTLNVVGDETTIDGIDPDCQIAATGGPFVSGTDPSFDLGSLSNNDMDADNEFVLIEFDALVLNDVLNQQGATLDNTFDVSIDGNSIGTMTTAFAQVVEPQLACSIDVSPNPVDNLVDPNPTVSYTFTLTNNGLASAFQAGAPAGGGFAMTLPVGLENITSVVVTPTGDVFRNGTATPVVAGDFAISGGDNNVLTAATPFQFAPAASLDIAFDTTLQSSVSPGDSLTSDCAVRYAGQAIGDSGASVRDDADLGSGTGNTPVTDPTNLNDYRSEATVTLDVSPENPQIGLAKQVSSGPTNNGDGSYTLTYSLVVENTGDIGLDNLQIVEPLATTFSGASFIVDDVTVTSTNTTLVENPSFTGNAPNDGLLDAGSSTLGIGDVGTLAVTVTVTPGANLGTFNNQATASADSTGSGTTVNDLSDDGTDPDGNGNGDPGDDSDVTPVTFAEDAEIGLAKAVSAGPTNNGDGTYTFTYQFVVENSGDVDLADVQVSDSLATVLAGTTFTVDSLSSTDFSVNGGFDGNADTQLLSAGNTLAAGSSGAIDLVITVTPGANLGQFDNTATVSATSPSGATPGDTSSDGTDPDTNGNGDPTDDSTPTPVVLAEAAEIGLAKSLVGTPTNNADGTYSLQYRLFVENTGDVALSSLQITDDLATVFADATSFVVTAVTSSDVSVNFPGFTGTAPNTGLLTGTDTLAAGTGAEVFLSLTVEPGTDLGPYDNTATASGNAPSGAALSDISDNSLVTDENGVNGPGDDSDVTPVSFVDSARIGVAKVVSTGPTNNGDGTYSLSYSIVVENAGDVVLNEVSVSEPLATTFADATGFVIDNVASTEFVLNPSFDGDADAELLAAGNTLAIAATGTVVLDLTITPGADLGPYDNSVVAQGTSPANDTVSDTSVDGTDPDADNDSDPNNDTGPTSTTFVEDAEIGVAKVVSAGPTNNGDGSYTLSYQIVVENSGDVALSDVQVDE
ncbi:MAG: hypothetical protein AAGA84_05555, partial [Pseudomonadota bacterium]